MVLSGSREQRAVRGKKYLTFDLMGSVNEA
jgi:hypothetical protein